MPYLLDELDAMIEHEQATRQRLLDADEQKSDLIYISEGTIRGLRLAKQLIEETE